MVLYACGLISSLKPASDGDLYNHNRDLLLDPLRHFKHLPLCTHHAVIHMVGSWINKIQLKDEAIFDVFLKDHQAIVQEVYDRVEHIIAEKNKALH